MKIKRYEVPLIWEAALLYLQYELDRVMWNIYQKEYESPFSNTGNRFDALPEFIAEAYSWNDDYNQPFNFKWRDIEIEWYKYLGRGMSSNKILTPETASTMIEECVQALQKMEKEQMKV